MSCNMTNSSAVCGDLKLGSEVLACESCRRILYIEAPPVDVRSANERLKSRNRPRRRRGGTDSLGPRGCGFMPQS